MLACYPGIERTPMFAVLDRCMRERRSETFENEFEYEDGRCAWFELRIQPCPEGLIVMSLDITERKHLESTLRQSEKLRALGQMAAGVAHDLKNILNPIALQLRLLRGRGLDHPGTDAAFAAIEDAIRTGTDTVESLSRFSRREPEHAPEPTDLNRMSDAALEICRPRLGEHAGVAVRRERDHVPPVRVRASELVSAIVNLLLNSLDATSSGGTITLRTGGGGGGWVEVADDGPGIPPEVEDHIFEPFFTTKPHGTGLGLAMVYAFVHRYGGRIEIDTALGAGTRIRMTFPPADATRVAPGSRPGTRRLLVVEDDPTSLRALKMLLEDEGFTVETASDAEAALARVLAFVPDAIVTDFRLPGIDGAGLARAARHQRATLPVVFMSGADTSYGALAALLREPQTKHVTKPLDFDKLVAALNAMVPPA
jgi:signal transduction histidine kinase/CheY-like chemotaxis protein